MFCRAARRPRGKRVSTPSRDVAVLQAAARLDDAKRALEALLATPDMDVDTEAFERAFELDRGAASALYLRTNAVLMGVAPPIAWPRARVAEITQRVVATLANFHAAHPEDIGMPARQLKGALPHAIPTSTYLALLRHLGEQRTIEWRGARVQLRGHAARSDAADRVLWERCQARLLDRGMHPFLARELACELGVSETALSDLLRRRRARGELSQLDEERYLAASQVAALAATAAEIAGRPQGPGLTAAHFRDVVGTGRNLAVRILEFLDDLGVTRRDGDARTVTPDFEMLVGPAPTCPIRCSCEAARPQRRTTHRLA